MLDFLLVLGLVPGTNYQINFTQVLGFCLLWAAFLLYRRRASYRRRFWQIYYTYADTFGWLSEVIRFRQLVR